MWTRRTQMSWRSGRASARSSTSEEEDASKGRLLSSTEPPETSEVRRGNFKKALPFRELFIFPGFAIL